MVKDCQHIKSPRKIVMEPRINSIWKMGIHSFVVDTSGYLDFYKSIYNKTSAANDIISDIDESFQSECQANAKRASYKLLLKDCIKKISKLNKSKYYKHYRCSINDCHYYSCDFDGIIIADINIDIYVSKLIVEYSRVSSGEFSVSTIFCPQYVDSISLSSFRYRIKKIKRVLPIKDRDSIRFNKTDFVSY